MESGRVRKGSRSVLFLFLKLGTSFRKAKWQPKWQSAFRRATNRKRLIDRGH